ncbi:Brr1p [Saccharomyces paradoxus]|uniref:Brr1p n=1 Tax=Saccharomyces paradoxus TaxID=27291 RepID=A0A8B8V1D1_SACPA|nr:Brr1 [Saccharomyces paradoxus]QHS76780.1 Brr1 [Saccharomyces paradoxus]
MKRGDSQSPDAIFGQSRAFALSDSSVNPDVIEYLKSVRQEALRTNAISVKNQMNLQKRARHKSSMYDDEDEGAIKRHVISPSLIRLQKNADIWVSWFNSVKATVLTNAYEFTGYDDETLNLLLLFLKNYLKDMPSKSTTVEEIINVLNQYSFPDKTEQKEENFEIDEEWAKNILVRLEKIKIGSVEDVKKAIIEGDKHELIGYNQWFQYIINNEPQHTTFHGKITSKQLWVLVRYMSNTWIKEIYKKGRHYRRLQDWLFYILVHTPERLTAEYTSILRDLGKKCLELIQKKPIEAHENKITLPKEMTELNVEIPSTVENMTITELTVSVVAVNYGQRDLIE